MHWCPGANLWAVMRYHDAETILKHPHLSRQAYLDTLEVRAGRQPITDMQRRELVFTDNPRHEKLRRLIGTAINAQSIGNLQATTDTLVEQKFAPLLARGKFDVIGDFVLTLPTSVAAAWLGVPDEERERVTAWIFPLVSGRGVARDPETTAAANKAATEMRAYFDALMKQRRAAPANDLISGLLAVQAQDPSLLSDDDIFGLIVAVFAAGHTPGIALMALTLLALLQNPDQLARLRADPSLLPLVIEEGLRYASPTQAPNPLVALEDINVGGKTIRRGQAVTVILASANRDPEIFPDPDRFDAGRTPNHHIAFSVGPHFCIGAMLTRMQAEKAIAALTQRLPDLQLACDIGDLKWIPHDRFRTLASLPVSFRPS